MAHILMYSYKEKKINKKVTGRLLASQLQTNPDLLLLISQSMASCYGNCTLSIV